MRKRITALLTAACLAMTMLLSAGAAEGVQWAEEERAKLRVGNPTPLRGRFFTAMWGGTTSDLDVQDLLQGYSPVRYDIGMSTFRFDHSVVQDAMVMDDAEGNRTYLLVFYDDLKWSNGTPITAADYAFSILFCMDPVISETGGKPMDYSWIEGAEEYLNQERETLSGVRVITEQMLQIKIKAEALPYFYELSRLMIHPYPISAIAPGCSVKDEGEGVYLSEKLTAEMIEDTVLDPETGYLTHPYIVSGPYTLTEYAEGTAKFRINPYYKGTEEGILPRIGELEYTLAENSEMIENLREGDFGLLNKTTMSQSIQDGIRGRLEDNYAYTAENYARTGLTELWFMESSPLTQEPEVRKAIAECFDRENFILAYTGPYGIQVDGFFGIGQWMYRLAAGQIGAPTDESLPAEEAEAATKEYEALSLDGLTKYSADVSKAAERLEAAGWTKNEAGIRCKQIGEEETELRMTLGMPESEEAREALEKYFIQNLREAGIEVTVKIMTMQEIERAYEGKEYTADLLYLGENFTILFDPAILEPWTEKAEEQEEGSLPRVKAELYGMALDMVKTEPKDILGFMKKWIALQERITETLPLLPVYSNVYFDFFTRELHDYNITQAVTWGEAIVKSYISDAEEPGEAEQQNLQEQLDEIERRLRRDSEPEKLKE